MSLICALATVATLSPYLPDPADKFGWGLRVRLADPHPPYLTHEVVWWGRLEVLLINRTKEEREFVPHEPDPAVGAGSGQTTGAPR